MKQHSEKNLLPNVVMQAKTSDDTQRKYFQLLTAMC